MSVSHFRAEGSSKIQARMEQQPTRPPQPSQPPPPPPPMPFRAPTKPPIGPKTSPLKDNPSPEPQLDDIKRGRKHFLEPKATWNWVLRLLRRSQGYYIDITWALMTWVFSAQKKYFADFIPEVMRVGAVTTSLVWQGGPRNSDLSCGCLCSFS